MLLDLYSRSTDVDVRAAKMGWWQSAPNLDGFLERLRIAHCRRMSKIPCGLHTPNANRSWQLAGHSEGPEEAQKRQGLRRRGTIASVASHQG